MRLELQHVSIAIPPGRRTEARAFYGELLGLAERAVPPKLNPDELIWFRVGGDLELHLFDSNEPAPLSQHFCLRIDSGLEELRGRLEDAGIETHDTDEIAIAEFAVDGIDPHIEQKPTARPRERRHDQIAGCQLLGGSDGVLEVEDHRVGIERQRFFDPPRVISRRKQKASQRLNGCPPEHSARHRL